MKIVRPYAKLIIPLDDALPLRWDEEHLAQRYGISLMRKIEWCARISHRAEGFIKSVVLDHGDWSVVEHASATVDMLVDRGITHELVRHRLFSFTQESTRFVRYFEEKEGDIINPAQFIYPIPEIECPNCLAGNEPIWRPKDDGIFWHASGRCVYHTSWLTLIMQCEETYRNLLTQGWKPQEARSVFPNALASRIIVTGNLRNWRHFFIMRVTAEAHPQMRQMTIPLLADFQKTFPLLFDDIVPMAKQSEQMKKAR